MVLNISTGELLKLREFVKCHWHSLERGFSRASSLVHRTQAQTLSPASGTFEQMPEHCGLFAVVARFWWRSGRISQRDTLDELRLPDTSGTGLPRQSSQGSHLSRCSLPRQTHPLPELDGTFAMPSPGAAQLDPCGPEREKPNRNANV